MTDEQAAPPRSPTWSGWLGSVSRPRARAVRGVLAGLAGALLLGGVTLLVAVGCWSFPRDLLEPRSVGSLTVLDAEGRVLRQTATEAGGRETWVPLGRVSTALIHATFSAEDRRFYDHAGVDPMGVLRAVWLDLRARRPAFGASTITMQLVRMVDPRALRKGRSFAAKVREAILAVRLERLASKDEILEQYLNRLYYGHGAWGVEAAAQRYFGKPASALSLGEATLLSVLPRSPQRYDPLRHIGRALERRRHVLALMEKNGDITREQRELAERAPLSFRHDQPGFAAPHFVDYVVNQLTPEQRRGATVRTTLDGPLQRQLEVSLRDHLRGIGRNIGQAGLVVLRNRDGAILSMVGSREYFDAERAGAANVTLIPRRPGSTLKPFVYGVAFERGESAATVAYDVVLDDETHEGYSKDVKQHGFARYRESLAGSYNLSAVHTLRKMGPSAVLARLRAAGLTTLDRPDDRYDASLAIGDATVRLIELTGAYATFGTGGTSVVPTALTTIEQPGLAPVHTAAGVGNRVFAPEIAYLVFDILSDPDARRPMFGRDVPMELPFPVALKTGTTRAYTDNLAFGVTREYTVGAWAGNADGTPTDGVMAMQGAAPLVRAAFVALAARFGDPTAPPRPDSMVEADVCPLSGMRPGPHCPTRKHEIFVPGTVPEEECTWHRQACGEDEIDYPEALRGWVRAHGMLHPSPCATSDTTLRILFPVNDSHFLIDPDRPRDQQLPPLRAAPARFQNDVVWSVDGRSVRDFLPSPGEHVVRASWNGQQAEVRVSFE